MLWPGLLRVDKDLVGKEVQKEVWGLLKQVLTFGQGTIICKYCL